MPKSSAMLGRIQLGRLLQLILHLRAGRFPNASALAEFCEVSRRTVYRDLQTLALAGVPVRYRNHPGGYEIAPGFFLESPRLEESEAEALVLQALRPGPRSGPDRAPAAYRALQKIAQAMPEGLRERVLALIEALREEDEGADFDADRRLIHEALIHALSRRQALRLWIREPGTKILTATKLSPLKLTLAGDCWRVTGRSSLHRRDETFRVAWIVRAIDTGEMLDEPRTRRAAGTADRGNPSARLRFDARSAPQILDGRCPRDHRLEAGEDGSVEMTLPIHEPEAMTGWILSFGDAVEVIGPASLRDQVRETARRVARLNAAPPDRAESGIIPREAVTR